MSTESSGSPPDPTTTIATSSAPISPHEPIVETATKPGTIRTPEPPAGYRWLIPGKDKIESTDMTWTGLKVVGSGLESVVVRTLEPVFHAQAGTKCFVFNTYLRRLAVDGMGEGSGEEILIRELKIRLQSQTLCLTKLAHWMEMEEIRTSSKDYSSALVILNFIIDASKSKDTTANE